DEPRALHMAEVTLKAMHRGGIFDHLGGGFHRYSTDDQWLVPHFEKMLYDQALITTAYVEAFQATKDEEYRAAADSTFAYVLAELTGESGQFFSGEDADSEGVEGKFYVWSEAEIDELLDAPEAELIKSHFSVESAGNFRDEATGVKTGDNILHIKGSAPFVDAELDGIKEKLFKARAKRIRPALDDKALTDWNALMITALSKGGSAFGDDRLVEAAVRAASFIIENMITPDGRLLHCLRGTGSSVEGFVDDYAFFISALIDLYEANFDAKYLEIALKLQRVMIEDFWDAENGGFFFTTKANKDVLVRQKNFYDGAMPSGNSIALGNLFRLSRMTEEVALGETAERLLGLFSTFAAGGTLGFIQFINSAFQLLGPAYEAVIAGKPGAKDTDDMLQAIRGEFLPGKVLIFRAADGEKAKAYICRDRACAQPTTDIKETLALLKSR
ncbi:MAG: thioredoxin domain-containing protein, partial [Proteobacteria bacterium]|nr:thioredoxin domain-containing protein [Pseudomonadota bacterium]